MIELTDTTLLETGGYYENVVGIMSREAPPKWVILTRAMISTGKITSQYELEFWYDGRIMILNTDHPSTILAPDDDLRELAGWAKGNGWKSVNIHTRLLSHPMDFEFWKRMYQCGLIQSEQLKEYDENEMARMTKAYTMTETENAPQEKL
jgi:hypothetical protein